MKTITRAATSLLLCAMLLCSAGCGALIIGGAAAAGTYVYLDGQAKGTYDATLQKSLDAGLAACKSLGIPVTSQSMDGASAKIVGKLSGDTVYITMHLVGDNLILSTLHVLSGEAVLVAIPFTRLSHALFIPFTRAYMGSEFGGVRQCRDW